jgi:ribosomal protein L37E
MSAQRIQTNSARCRRCGDVLVSEYRRDFKWCSCGGIAVDGGKDYLKRCGDPSLVEDLSQYIEEEQ